jgi:Protein of unknown function (DUF1428)
MGVTNIFNTVSASQDEEVWLELQYYRDRKHLDEVRAKCGNDENMEQIYEHTPEDTLNTASRSCPKAFPVIFLLLCTDFMIKSSSS